MVYPNMLACSRVIEADTIIKMVVQCRGENRITNTNPNHLTKLNSKTRKHNTNKHSELQHVLPRSLPRPGRLALARHQRRWDIWFTNTGSGDLAIDFKPPNCAYFDTLVLQADDVTTDGSMRECNSKKDNNNCPRRLGRYVAREPPKHRRWRLAHQEDQVQGLYSSGNQYQDVLDLYQRQELRLRRERYTQGSMFHQINIAPNNGITRLADDSIGHGNADARCDREWTFQDGGRRNLVVNGDGPEAEGEKVAVVEDGANHLRGKAN